jgi:hypothetical protein
VLPVCQGGDGSLGDGDGDGVSGIGEGWRGDGEGRDDTTPKRAAGFCGVFRIEGG